MRIKIAALMLLTSGLSAQAEDPMMSFAAAQVPEQGVQVCFLGDAVSAAECALEQCRKETGSDECIITSACGPGFAGSMGVMAGETHWTETVCGAPDEKSVIAALTAFCKGEAKNAKECYIADIWDERGKKKTIGKTLIPKKLK